MSPWTPGELGWLRLHHPNLPLCRQCGYPLNSPDNHTSHPMCDPAVAEIIRRAA